MQHNTNEEAKATTLRDLEDDTEPAVFRRLSPPQGGRLHYERRGCWMNFLVGVLALFFACGACLALYVIFPPAATDILVLGLDSREGEGMVARTDSVMVVGVNPGRLQISVLSIPRDLFLDVPGYGPQRINTVNMLGEMEQAGMGPELVAQTMEQSMEIGIDRYIRLDFDAFVSLVDAVGGVDIYVEKQIVDPNFPTPDGGTQTVRFETGWQHMDGQRALIYARTRYADDDYHRAGRQQQVLTALALRLVNPLNWPGALAVLQQHVDTNLNLWDMARLAPAGVLSVGRIQQLVIDRDYILPGNGYSVPNYEALQPWIEPRFD